MGNFLGVKEIFLKLSVQLKSSSKKKNKKKKYFPRYSGESTSLKISENIFSIFSSG
jgi:hypothetical protein